MQNAARKIEIAANIAIVIVACVAVLVLIRNYRASSSLPPSIKAGTRLALKNENWSASSKNVVLAVSTTCRFCTESAPFYRALVEQCRRDHVRTIAVLPQPLDQAEAYLKGEGVTVDEIRQTPLSEIEIAGTPTLMLVDNQGVVRNVWVGKLPEEREKEVLNRIGL